MRKFAPRKSLRDTKLANNAADRYYASMAGKEPMAQSEIKPKRERAASKPMVGASEAQVLKSVRDALYHHPKVAFVWRMQSGLFIDGDRKIRVGFAGMPDLLGMLKGGQLFACEVKREQGGALSAAQQYYLHLVRESGGRAGVARSVEDAIAIIQS